jgi:lipid-A-disaccharide synthase
MISKKPPYKIHIIAGEHSGDALGGKLMQALKEELGSENVTFQGLGSEAMEKEGLKSLFPMEEVAIMGPFAILIRLPNLIKRVHQCVDHVLEHNPDGLIIIDSPEFTHPIAKRVRQKAPHIPIVNYVSPTIWAWRPGRAKKMKPYVDEVLALLPFEPEKHKELGGPSCHYVGHPLIEQKRWIKDLDEESLKIKLGLNPHAKILTILPGSRSNEIKHLMQPFGEVVGLLEKEVGPLEVLLPTVNSVKESVRDAVKSWPIRPHIIEGKEDKFKAFKCANASLAASGTVTLELALTGTAMVVAYKYDKLLHLLRPLIKADMFALANHILGKKAFPEYIQYDCTPENITRALAPLFDTTSKEYKEQKSHLDQIEENMFAAGKRPSIAAARQAIATIYK